MKGKLSWSIFWALVGIFVVIVSIFFSAASIPAFRGSIFLWFIISFGTVFFLLGVALIFLTAKEKVGGILKKFLLLTGASAAGIFVSVLLHNAVYALCIYFFGMDFWNGGDEPFFFHHGSHCMPNRVLGGSCGHYCYRHQEPQGGKKITLQLTVIQPVTTKTLTLTPKITDVTLHLPSEATQSSSLESRLDCEKGWHSLSPQDRGCLCAG